MTWFINPYIDDESTPPITPGDVIIGSGTTNFRDAPVAYYYDNSYSGIFLTPSQLSGIPNGATITKIEFETELLTNGTYSKIDVNKYMYQVPATFTSFPSNCRVNGYSSTDTTYNNAINNYQQVDSLADMTIVKISSHPNVMWRGFNFVSPYQNFDNTQNLCIIFNCLDSDYAPGSQTYPRIKSTFGTYTRAFYNDKRDNSPYNLTDFVNFQASYFPNIRIHYE